MSLHDEREALTRLARLDSCALSDALDKLSLRGLVVIGLAPRSVPVRIAGRVHTVKLDAGAGPGVRAGAGPGASTGAASGAAPGGGTRPGAGAGPALAGGAPPRHLGTAAIEAAASGEVIVLEQRTGCDAACWGGLLSRGAKLKGIVGVIADGPVRDIDEAREIAFPVYSRGVTARTARGRIHESGTDVPVRIGDVDVYPGDYALADSSGVVFLRPDRLVEVLGAAEAIAAREAGMLERITAGRSIAEVMGGEYERMLRNRSEEGLP